MNTAIEDGVRADKPCKGVRLPQRDRCAVVDMPVSTDVFHTSGSESAAVSSISHGSGCTVLDCGTLRVV
jgi:hypothetical protein